MVLFKEGSQTSFAMQLAAPHTVDTFSKPDSATTDPCVCGLHHATTTNTTNTISDSDAVVLRGDANTSSNIRTALIQAAFSLCVFQAGLDAVVVSNALSATTHDLGSSVSEVAWVGSAYNLAWASFLLAWAGISNVAGRKSVLLSGLLLFVVGSVLAAVSKIMPMMLAGRVIQGLGAGACQCTISFSINDMFALRLVLLSEFLCSVS